MDRHRISQNDLDQNRLARLPRSLGGPFAMDLSAVLTIVVVVTALAVLFWLLWPSWRPTRR